MTRLPQPGSDEGKWGNILNDFLAVEHNSDGTLKNVARPSDIAAGIPNGGVTTAKLADGAVTNAKLDAATQQSLTKADNALPASQKDANNGVAGLDANGLIKKAEDRGGAYMGNWAANTSYKANDTVVAPDGSIQSAKADFTSGSSYSAADWNPQDSGIVVANYKTGDYTLQPSDAGSIIEIDSSASQQVIIPASDSFAVGSVVEVFRMGTGAVTIAAAVPQLVNLCLNPSLEVDTSNWGTTNAVRSTSASMAPGGSYGLRKTAIAGGTLQTFYSSGVTSLSQLGLAAGDALSVGTYLNTSVAGGAQLQVQFWNGSNTTLMSGQTFVSSLATGITFHRVLNVIVPAGADTVRIIGSTTATTAGDTLDQDGLIIVKGATLPATGYADGDTTGWSWQGTPGASRSTNNLTGTLVRNQVGRGTTIAAQYGSAVLRKRATRDWVLDGGIA